MKMNYEIKILRISLYTVQSNGHWRMGGFAETKLHWEEVIQGQIIISIFHLLCRRLLSFCNFKSLHFSMWTIMFWTVVLDEVVINRVERNAEIHLYASIWSRYQTFMFIQRIILLDRLYRSFEKISQINCDDPELKDNVLEPRRSTHRHHGCHTTNSLIERWIGDWDVIC